MPPGTRCTPTCRTPRPWCSGRWPRRSFSPRPGVPLRQEAIELAPEPIEHLVVAEGPDHLRLPLQVDVVGRAPEAEIGVVGLAGAVDPAAHHRDGDRVVARVS